jgi:hypothetical protein
MGDKSTERPASTFGVSVILLRPCAARGQYPARGWMYIATHDVANVLGLCGFRFWDGEERVAGI